MTRPVWLSLAVWWLIAVLPNMAMAAPDSHPELRLTGVEDKVLKANIAALVNVSRYECQAPEWRFRLIRKRAERDALRALHALGYYRATMKIQREKTPQCWTLVIDLDPGPRMTVDAVRVRILGELEQMPGWRQLRKQLPVRPGQPLNHADYDTLKQQIEALASRYGFLNGHFTQHALIIDKAHNKARVDLVFDSGSRARIGTIRVEQTQFSPRFIRKLLILKEGEPFDSAALTRQQAALNDSGYFSSVEVEVDRRAADQGVLPVTIRLKPRKRHAYRIGLGASTNEGPRVSAKFENRWSNRLGHSYVFDSRWSPVITEGTLDYAIPLGDAGDHRLNIGIGSREERTSTSLSRTLKTSAQLTRQYDSGWKTITSLAFLREDFTTADSDARVKLLMPGFSFSKSKRERFLFPRAGWRISSAVQTAVEGLLSDLDMVRLTGQIKLIRPIADRARLLARGGAGLTNVSDFARLPASLRFYAGGDNSVRGFGYKSLGPVNAQGEVIGGRYFLTGSLEYDFMVRQPFSIAAFIDAGNAFNDFNHYDMKKSVGIGVRYHSPIGPIRLDLAHDLEGSASAIRLHLSMGPDL